MGGGALDWWRRQNVIQEKVHVRSMQKERTETPLRSPTQISGRIDERGSEWRGTEVKIDN